MTLRIKCPVTRFLFGSMARTGYDGTPMVRALTRLSCAGVKGYGSVANRVINARTADQNILHQGDSAAERSMLLMTRRPSCTTLGMDEKSEFSSTISEYPAGDVAARGHSYGAVGGFQGQDIVDTITGHGDGPPGGLHGIHQHPLLLRRHAPEDSVLQCGGLDLRRGRQCPGVDGLLRARDASPHGHIGDRRRVIAGDDLDLAPPARQNSGTSPARWRGSCY